MTTTLASTTDVTTASPLPRVRPLAVTAHGVVSPAGTGLDALAEALRGTREACSDAAQLPLGPAEADGLPDAVRVVPDFRIADHVGRKGTRHLDRTTALGLAAAAVLRSSAGASPDDPGWAATGVVLGSTSGSVRSSSEFARDTHVEDRPYLVNAAAFPNTVMNSVTGQVAIWHGLRGINATLSGGTTATLAAFRYARNALTQGHADRLLVGGVEELCPQTAWGWAATGALAPGTPVGEGAALFAVEDAEAAREAGTTVLAEVLACETAFVPEGVRPGLTGALADCIDRALRRSGVDASEVALVAPGADGLIALEGAEQRALRRVLGDREVEEVRVKDVVGEAYSADGALQVAAVLAHWQGTPADGGRIALVTGLGHDGNVACLVLRDGADR
ncbi:beta-ketoacyl synthase N-terminal-like domain-containing protein [Streptomyces sp. SP18CS02]|uniref:beta-ketoacyl synthase N-terminal-like domain-containing protein n=1 Tax=Streptomyces sp. SP18CS02 TaxID=3002531 RepID=UPI002E76E2BE|nr:beta-ketoacyl synthase N-terminal-like domain-containing protein [Streptomyces sp. SP18CS02]MEE1756663.1 beta-ketoacyl synthase N-terminal-like domain-containing protein [Streptomyces sp. SP18CS02]